MIKAIQFENYKSFREKQNLIFNAEKNIYLIYGKNSSGKTNLYRLFSDISRIVNDNNFFADRSFASNINVFCKEQGNNVFKLTLVFENDNIEYGYTIHIDYSIGVIYESLQTEDEEIFVCDNGKIASSYIDDNLVERIQTFELTKTSLLAILFNENIAKESTSNFDFKNLRRSFEYIFKADGRFVEEYLDNDQFKVKYLSNVLSEIATVDFGIDGIDIEEIPVDVSDELAKLDLILSDLDADNRKRFESLLGTVNNRKIVLYSMRKGIRLNYNYESRGTKLYIDYVSTFMYEYFINNRRTFIFDELDSSLSSALVKKLIKFLTKNFTDAQLIFSTHNTHLLDANIELGLTKDNYIIVDKRKYDSNLYRLNSFEGLRNDNRNNFERMYLGGRFGGIHEFD